MIRFNRKKQARVNEAVSHAHTSSLKRIAFGLLCFWVFVSTFGASCQADAPCPTTAKAPPAAKTLGPGDSLRISGNDHCPVCGMFPVRMPQCAAGMRLSDGRTYYFCSNRCLLMAWKQPEKTLGEGTQIDRLVVLDYFSGRPLNGLTAWWIVGSDVVGPMGPALVAFQSDSDVEAFRRRHGGMPPFKLHQLDASMWGKILPVDE